MVCYHPFASCPMPSCQPPKGATLRKVSWPFSTKCPSCNYVYGQEDIISIVDPKVAKAGELCAKEGGTCDCDGDVYFGGAKGRFYWWRRANVAGPVYCGVSTFRGRGTECRCRRREEVCPMASCSGSQVKCSEGESRLKQWGQNGCPVPCKTICGKAVHAPDSDKGKWVAKQNQGFYCKGTAYYGRKSSFVSKQTNGKVICNDSTFGDPLRGQSKYCTCDGSTKKKESTEQKIWKSMRRF